MIPKHYFTFVTFASAQAFAQELLFNLDEESGYKIEGMPVTINYQTAEGFILEIADELVTAMGILKIGELLDEIHEEIELDENDETISEADDMETDEDYIVPSSHCLHCGIAFNALDGFGYLCPACD